MSEPSNNDSNVNTMGTFNNASNTGVTHLINATRFSMAGLKSAYLRESAFRQELLLFAVLVSSAAWLTASAAAWLTASAAALLALICACLLFLSIELLNSGIEAAIDRIGLERDELAKQAKDYGSAAVFLVLTMTITIWLYILYDAFKASL